MAAAIYENQLIYEPDAISVPGAGCPRLVVLAVLGGSQEVVYRPIGV
jgi:hypothetical protein